MPPTGPRRREFVEQLDRSSRVVTETASFTADPRVHGDRVTLLSVLTGLTVTLPPAIGSGVVYEFFIGILHTSNDYIIQVANRPSLETFNGVIRSLDVDTSDQLEGFASVTTAGADTITLNRTTTGGDSIGERLWFQDYAATLWFVDGDIRSTGTLVTPFSASS